MPMPLSAFLRMNVRPVDKQFHPVGINRVSFGCRRAELRDAKVRHLASWRGGGSPLAPGDLAVSPTRIESSTAAGNVDGRAELEKGGFEPWFGVRTVAHSWFCLPSNRGRDFVPWHDGPTPFTMKTLAPAGGVAVNPGLSGRRAKGDTREGICSRGIGFAGRQGRGARGGPGRNTRLANHSPGGVERTRCQVSGAEKGGT